ncbi:MATE family efflux transporter [Proteinivorax hydrogeniformans]|uniref:Probable multidrug resistance protein NorM n=1 Tax=Proteinivorax hydrogeniformans TaxID=1826727 RepID=A0AAU8HR27_9FIRM
MKTNTLTMPHDISAKGTWQNITTILLLAWPIMLSQFLQTILGIVDVYFISMLDSNELIAAISYGNEVLHVTIAAAQFVVIGSLATISRRIGAKDMSGAEKMASQGILLAFLTGAIFLSFLYFQGRPFLYLFGATGNILDYGANYLKVLAFATPFIFFNLTARGILQAKGDTFTPMLVFCGMNILNIFFNWVFIFGVGFVPEFGYLGAALGTVISNIIAACALVIMLEKKFFHSSLWLAYKKHKVIVKDLWTIVKIGSFAMVQGIARPITALLMYSIANNVSLVAITAFGIGGRMIGLVFITIMGLTQAMSVLTGQNLGRGDVESVERYGRDGLKFAFINMLIFFIPFFIFAEQTMSLFTDDPAVIAEGVSYFRIVYPCIFFVIFPAIYGGIFMGSGDTAPPMLASLVANLGFKYPFARYFANYLDLGASWVWLGIGLSVLVEMIIIVLWYRKGKWKTKKV